MRAKLFRTGSAEPLCDADLEIQGDAAYGAPFEAKLRDADAHLAAELQDGLVFVANDGTRYEGDAQHAFHVPQHGVLLLGSLKQR